MPGTPSSTGHVMSSVAVSKTSWPTWRSVSSSTLRITGPCITSWWPCSGASTSRLPSAPMPVETDMTTASRIGSIGGVVTCAKSCLKYEESGGGWSPGGRRGVSVAHRADGLLPARRHRRHQHAQVLLRVAEGHLAQQQRLDAGQRDVGGREVGEVDAMVVEPLAVRALPGDLGLDLGVLDDPVALEVDEEELAGL